MNKYIAIEFYGQLRGFRFENTRNLFYERIIKQLQNQGFIVHIFLHTYDIMGNDSPDYNSFILGEPNEVINLINSLDRNKFDVKLFKIDLDKKQHDFLQNNYKLEEKYNFYKHWSKNNKYGWFKFTYSIKMVNKLRIDYEYNNNIKYDWVILTNPQMEPQNNIDNFNLLNNKFMYSPGYAYFGGYYTSFLIGNCEHINYIAELYDYMIEKKFNNDKNKYYIYFKECLINSEPIFKQYIDSKYIMKPILNIRFNRIRYSGYRVNH